MLLVCHSQFNEVYVNVCVCVCVLTVHKLRLNLVKDAEKRDLFKWLRVTLLRQGQWENSWKFVFIHMNVLLYNLHLLYMQSAPQTC